MKIRKVSADEASRLRGAVPLPPETVARLVAYRGWLGFTRHEKIARLGSRVVMREPEKGDGD